MFAMFVFYCGALLIGLAHFRPTTVQFFDLLFDIFSHLSVASAIDADIQMAPIHLPVYSIAGDTE